MARRYNIDLRAHLAECDGNYHRLQRLLPGALAAESAPVTVRFGSRTPAVLVHVLDRCRYTTVVALRQCALAPGVTDTCIKVRLYHDARCAEVIEFQGQRQFEPRYEYPNPRMRQPDEKVQVNRFLRELLNLCLLHGVVNEQTATVDP